MNNCIKEKFFDDFSFEEQKEPIFDIDYNFKFVKEKIEQNPDIDYNFKFVKEKIEPNPDIDYNFKFIKEEIESNPDTNYNFKFVKEKLESISNYDYNPKLIQEKIDPIQIFDYNSNFEEKEKIIIKNISINKDPKNNNEENDSFDFTMGYNLPSLFISTNFKSDKPIKDTDLTQVEQKSKNKEKIFGIVKKNKNKGRIRNDSNLIGNHNKFFEDNIIRKFKGRFIENCRIYINKEYEAFLLNNEHETRKEKILLQRISPELSRRIAKDDNLKWLDTKLFQIFSEDVSTKCSLYDLDYNVKGIIKLYREKKAKNIINILNSTVREMLEAFIQNKIPGFGTLDDDLKNLEEKMKKTDDQKTIKQYLEKYRNKALNFEDIFQKKHKRKNK